MCYKKGNIKRTLKNLKNKEDLQETVRNPDDPALIQMYDIELAIKAIEKTAGEKVVISMLQSGYSYQEIMTALDINYTAKYYRIIDSITNKIYKQLGGY